MNALSAGPGAATASGLPMTCRMTVMTVGSLHMLLVQSSPLKGYSKSMRKYMTKSEALDLFRIFDRAPKGDKVWRREEWNYFTALMCRDGQISQKQCDNWSNPF